MYNLIFKRLFDIIISLFAIVVLSPIYIIIIIFELIFMGRPVLFKQPRPGKDGKIFNMYKFRTMIDKRDKKGNLLPDNQRLPKFGLFLRKTSLDEIPEFFSILVGKMSFVGPRPLLVEYLPYYTKRENKRHDVRPGLTGWAQVNGRNVTDWDTRLEQDVYYVENMSFLLDLKIIFLTIYKVLKSSDITVSSGGGRLDDVRQKVK